MVYLRVGELPCGTGPAAGRASVGGSRLDRRPGRGFTVEVLGEILADRQPISPFLRRCREVEQPDAKSRVGDIVEIKKLLDLTNPHALRARFDPAQLRTRPRPRPGPQLLHGLLNRQSGAFPERYRE